MYRTDKFPEGHRFHIAVSMMILLIMALAPLAAEDATSPASEEAVLETVTEEPGKVPTERDEVYLELSDMPRDEGMAYSFMYGYQAILEGKCKGAMLVLSDTGDYVAGYLTPDAPDDFCVRISPDTIAVTLPVQKDLLMFMFQMLGDRDSISKLMSDTREFFHCIIMFQPKEDMVLSPVWYAHAEKELETCAVAHGFNVDRIYEILYQAGYNKDVVIANIASGVPAEKIITDIMSKLTDIELAAVESNNKAWLEILVFAMIIVLALAFILFLGFLFFASQHKKLHPEESVDDDMTEMEAPETSGKDNEEDDK